MEVYFTKEFEKNLNLDEISIPSDLDINSWTDEQLMKAFLQQEQEKNQPSSGEIGDELFNRDIGLHEIQSQEVFLYSPPTGDIYLWTTDGFDKSVDVNETSIPESDNLEEWSSEQLMMAYYLETEENEELVNADVGTELFDRNIGAHHLAGQLVFLESR